MLNKEQPHGQGGAGVLIKVSNLIDISENNSRQWEKFQSAVFAYQQNHTPENLAVAQYAHKAWALEFLNSGRRDV